jgi:hypothetical protein
MPITSGLQRAAALLVSSLTLTTLAHAVETRVWQQDDASEFTRGTVKNLSIRSDGRLTLSPVFHEVADLATPYLWTVVEGSNGMLYCAGGAPTGSTAKVFSVSTDGKTQTLAQLNGLEIHALALDGKNRLYAATSPDSKVYRIGSDGKAEVFFDTKAKYVWAMAFDHANNLYVASGDQGVIYRVTPDGKGSEFFRTEETHARSMILDKKGNLIVGTEPGGYVLRVTPEGKSFVLFQSNKREITALAEHGDTIYAAASGGRPTQPSMLTPPAPTAPAAPVTGTTRAAITVQAPASQSTAPPSLGLLAGAGATAGGSDLFQIDEEGFAEKLWSSPTDVIYAVGFDAQGKPLLGTGNKGLVYRIDSATLATQLVNAPPTQVTAFTPGHNGVLYAVTGNVGKLYAIGPGYEKSGSIESEVLDAQSFAYWGKAHLLADLNGGTASISTRSGNVNRPQKNWSDWSQIEVTPVGGQISSPPARFLQYKLTLSASAAAKSPQLSNIQIAYLPKNIAPEVKIVQVESANYRASNSPSFLERNTTASGSPTSVTLPALGQSRRSASAAAEANAGLTVQYAKGYITARWSATDENSDTLSYRVEIKGKNENVWRLLKENILEKHFSFDGSAFADGEYEIRVSASDAPTNPPDQALSASLTSDPFTIDNTPPELAAGSMKIEGSQTVIRLTAKDALSWIDKAEYSINGSEWEMMQPQSRVSDSQQLSYELKLPHDAKSGEQVIAVRVFDDNDNEAVTRFVVPAAQ